MNLATIEATPEEATAKLDEYRAAVKERHIAEDEAILRGYKELEKGRSLIRLPRSFEVAGFNNDYLPKLGIARMIDKRIQVYVGSDTLTFYPSSVQGGRYGPWNDRASLNAGVVRVPIANPTPLDIDQRRHGEAIVPLVPPALRPARAQHRYFVLFEAEWQLIPPRDPALIRHLVGDMWVVLATWDLTELERAAIAGR